ncbi:hypothetical protein C8R44DRAFT_992060 [Mycena epipterygia]|nr:hypothetical protein C8R44DRAFT_992060 [Mycena epipterygia]
MQTRSTRLASECANTASPSIPTKEPHSEPEGRSKSTRSEPEEDVHCVRCHETYKPSRNGGVSCQIEHEQDAEGEHEMGGYRFTLRCCGLSLWSEYDDGPHEEWEPDMCFVGRHTTEHQYDSALERIKYSGADSCSDCDSEDEEEEEEEEDDDDDDE